MYLKIYKVSFLFCIIFLTEPTFCQQDKKMLDQIVESYHAKTQIHQKSILYTRTDKGVYELGEDLWFKTVNLNARNLTPFKADKTLYVRLVNKVKDSVVFQGKYELADGFASGNIYINDELRTGDYFLEYYSKSSYNPNDTERENVRLIKIVNQISQKVFSNDSLQNKTFNLRFFPEGGYLIHGITSKVAFKAVDSLGNPMNIKGTLFQNDKSIPLVTDYAGMGAIEITPQATDTFSIELSGYYKDWDYIFQFPEVIEKGMTLGAEILDDKNLIINIRGNTKPQKIYVRFQSRGQIHNMASGFLKDSLTIKLPIEELPKDIYEVTLLNGALEPVAERIIFINDHKKLNISSTLSNDTFSTKKKVSLEISVRDENNNPTNAYLWASVFDADYENLNDPKNILTHYYLSDQLRGKIYHPEYYFNEENAQRLAHLDLLLLTQGWRRFVWSEDYLSEQNFEPVLQDGVTGQLTSNFKSNSNNLNTILVTEPLTGQQFFESLNEQSKFTLEPSYLKLASTFYVQFFEEEKEKITVKTNESLEKLLKEKKDSYINYPLPKKLNLEYIPEPYPINNGINLEEVLITGKKSQRHKNKFLAQLDSIANIRITSDYLGIPCGTLNCPIHDMDRSKKPIAGETYTEMLGFGWVDEVRRSYKVDGYRTEEYAYKKYSEEELLEKFNLKKVIGYQSQKEFYKPTFDEISNNASSDYRKTLLWEPNIITVNDGKAHLYFYTSDITSKFIIIVEGIDKKGLLGFSRQSFRVTK